MKRNDVYCTIITIGDELLIGQTIDTNSAWIAQTLNPLGIQIKRRVAIGDCKADIEYALDEELKLSDIIIITGGLGPTADDITKPLLCAYFGGKLIMNELVKAHVQHFFAKRNRPMLESNTNQAMVPDVCEVLFNDVGTAPGMLFRKNDKLIFSLPGVPFEMKHITTKHLLPIIQSHFVTNNFIHRTIVTAGEGESFVANRLIDFEKNLPHNIKLAYLPKLGILKLRLTGIDIDENELDRKFNDLQELLADIMVAAEDIELEKQIGIILKNKGESIAIAESCTGGLISSMITSISGSSAYFKGGVIAYQNETKLELLGVNTKTLQTYSAVSKEVAIEMANQCLQKMNTTYALSITGYLEQGECDNEVWIGLASATQTLTFKISPPYNRQKNAVLASNTALNLLRKFILK
jgi:nicotinamide-nucleotide amidase